MTDTNEQRKTAYWPQGRIWHLVNLWTLLPILARAHVSETAPAAENDASETTVQELGQALQARYTQVKLAKTNRAS